MYVKPVKMNEASNVSTVPGDLAGRRPFHRGAGVNPGMSGLGAKICQKNHCLSFPMCSIHIKTLEIKEIDI